MNIEFKITDRNSKTLTKREQECLYWASQDKSLSETAKELHLSPETIKTHRKILLQKLNCRTMTGALMTAIKGGTIKNEQLRT